MRRSLLCLALLASVGACRAEFSEPANLGAISALCDISDEALARLKANGVTVFPQNAGGELQPLYYLLEEANVPVYVTSDAMLYAWHETHLAAMKSAEKQFLLPQLGQLVRGLLDGTQRLRGAGDSPPLRENAALLATVARLLDPSFEPPTDVAQQVAGEAARVIAHTDIQIYPGEDYTQYTVRGYYADDPALVPYFRGAKYLARRYMGVPDPEHPRADELRRAVLLALALREGQGLVEQYRSIYDLRAFLIGPADTIRLDELLQACDAVWGAGWSADRASDLTALNAELAKDTYRRMLIVNRPTDPSVATMPRKSVAVLGEHYIPDSDLFQRTRSPERMLPSGLDVATALGSEAAGRLLAATPNSLKAVTEARAFGKQMTSTGLYGAWLDTLKALFDRPQGLPAFAQSPVYETKQLNCCLTSWAQLRHNTLLYAAQAPVPGGVPMPRAGFVEPLPEFFARCGRMAAMLAEQLKQRGVVGNALSDLDSFAKKTEVFRRVAEDELAGKDTAWANSDVHMFGSWLRNFAGDNPLVVADISNDILTGQVLEVASGPFCPVVALIEEGGICTGAVGYVGSYYEFIEPNNKRLTDAEWRARAASDYTRPDPPAWLNPLYAAALPGDPKAIARLREIDTLLATGTGKDGEAAVERFVSEYAQTEYAPAAILALGRHLADKAELARAADVLQRAKPMYGCDARDEALALAQQCAWGPGFAKRQEAARRKLDEALKATDPKPGLTDVEEIRRQDSRARVLLGLAGRGDEMPLWGDALRSNVVRALQECPRSGYVPYGELVQACCRWEIPMDSAPPDEPERKKLGVQLAADLAALAERYKRSVVGQRASIARARLQKEIGDLAAAYETARVLAGLPKPNPDPYPLSAAAASRGPLGPIELRLLDYYGDGAADLLHEIGDALMQQAGANGDVGLIRRLLQEMHAVPSHIHSLDTDRVAAVLHAYDNEPSAQPDMLRLVIGRGTPALSQTDLALQIARKHPGTKAARHALLLATQATGYGRADPTAEAAAAQARALLAAQFPNSVESLSAEVAYLTTEGRYDEAIQLASRLRIAPKPAIPAEEWPAELYSGEGNSLGGPTEMKRQTEALTRKWGAFITEAKLDRKALAHVPFELSLAQELLRRLPERSLDVLLRCDNLEYLRDAAAGAISLHPHDARVNELRFRLGRPADLLAIVAGGPQTPHFAEAASRAEIAMDASDRETNLRSDAAVYERATRQYKGTPAATLAAEGLAKAHLKHERPERATEVLQAALAGLPEKALFREKLVAALGSAKRAVMEKRGGVTQKLWETPLKNAPPANIQATTAAGMLFVSSQDAEDRPAVACLDAATGAKLWETLTGGNAVSLVTTGRGLVIGTNRGAVLCLDRKTGAKLWRQELGATRRGKVWCVACGGTVLGYWDQGLLCALDCDTGQLRWQHDGLLAERAPVTDDARVYVGTQSGALTALRLQDGAVAWSVDWWSLTPKSQYGVIRSRTPGSFVVTDGRLVTLAGPFEVTNLVALAADTGRKLWSVRAEREGGLLPAGALVAHLGNGPGRGGGIAYRVADGRTAWSFAARDDQEHGVPGCFYRGGKLVLRERTGVRVLDTRQGQVLANAQVPDAICTDLTAAGELVTYSCQSGKVAAWRTAVGSEARAAQTRER